MKFKDINKRFTEIVASYLNRGYDFNTGVMHRFNGELGMVDLTDGHHAVRISVEPFSEYEDCFHHYYGYSITAGSLHGESVTDLNKVEIEAEFRMISQEKFYELGKNSKTGMEYGSRNMARRSCDLRRQRFTFRSEPDELATTDLNSIGMNAAKKYINRKLGIKRPNPSLIDVYRCANGGHFICYRHRFYELS